MTGITGGRVIVVDDEIDEAMPVLKALAKKGIASAFYDSDIDGLPADNSSRPKGVRLAILDMDLTGGGTSSKSKIATLVNCLRKILDPNNGPYVVLAWTKHSELIDLFEQAVFSQEDMPKPVHTIKLTKSECKTEGKLDLAIISEKLEDALVQFSPLLFLQQWEAKSFLAATEVTNGLSALVSLKTDDRDKYREHWKSEFLQLLYTMAKAEADKQLDSNTCLGAVYGSLAPLYADRMESHVADLSCVLTANSEEVLKYAGDCGVEKRARINTMLHLAFENLDRFTGGNLYVFSRDEKTDWLPERSRLIEDIVQREKNEEVTHAKVVHLCSASFPILVETSANCDHAQKNIRIARFLYGLLLPDTERKKVNRRSEFIWELGPLFLHEILNPDKMAEPLFEEPEEDYAGPYACSIFGKLNNVQDTLVKAGLYYFYLSARHLVSLDLMKAKDIRPFARLRCQALIDLQAWFARHAARPGMVLLRQP